MPRCFAYCLVAVMLLGDTSLRAADPKELQEVLKREIVGPVLPVAEVHQASQPPYEPNSYLPTAFAAELRDFVAWPAVLAGARQVAKADSPIAEIVHYDAPGRAVVFVIDHRARRKPRFRFERPDAAQFTRALAASATGVSLEKLPGSRLRVTLSIEGANAVELLTK